MKFRHPTIFLEARPVLAWILVAFYALIIFILSSFPYAPPEPGFLAGVTSTYKHIIEYSVFGFLLLAAFRSNGRTRRLAFLFSLFLAGFYGMTDEFHQFFVPGRTASFYDVLSDFFGGFIGAFFMNPEIIKLKYRI